MNDFMSWEILLTYGGCVMATILLTEWLKHVVTKVDAQIISAAIALVILVIGALVTSLSTPLPLVEQSSKILNFAKCLQVFT